MAKTETILTELKINYLTEEQYAEALASGEIVADEIYMTPASGSGVSDDILNDHIADTNNPHEVTAEQIGLGNVDNTADVDKTVKSATKLEAAKNIALTGDVTGSVSFDGSKDVSIDTTVTDISNVEAGVLGIAHGGTDATTAAEARTNLGVPYAGDYKVKTYSSLPQINLTNGSETIESIATNLPNNSMMLVTIGSSNAVIYPNQYGTLEVIKGGDATRVVFRFYQKTSGKSWTGAYDSTATTKWTGWKEIVTENNIVIGAELTSGVSALDSGKIHLVLEDEQVVTLYVLW